MTIDQLPHPADGISSDEALGAIYSSHQTVFRVWAPTAQRVTLNIYESPVGGSPRPMRMHKNRDGTWEALLLGDWKGIYYTFTAAGHDPRFDSSREVIDPYARAVTCHNGRGIVVHDETPIADRPDFPISEAIIYEMHVRDFTIDPDSGIQRRGRYLGLTEAKTHLTGRVDISTGIDHISQLGVNVVQLMPITEFHNDKANDRYGWGYDVVHFNSPEGWYATERFDGRRVAEVKRLVDAFHSRGMRVTLDMVLNHTFESITKHRVYSFEGLVPGYYYRLRRDGSYWDGSGTGNEFRTEAPMARRFLIDTLKHWVTEYKIDGFRIDLMGLIDRETLQRAIAELHAIDPKILVYGEPWAGGMTPIPINGKGAQRGQGWSVFNDHYRDALKGNVFDARATGFIQSGFSIDAVKRGVRGSIEDFAESPLESINYIECHDNHTIWDRILISTVENAAVTEVDRRAMDKLGAAMIFTSQGIPFLQAGQEFLRTKNGDHNSYDKSDAVNMIRWRQKLEHFDVFEYYRGLIELRRAHRLFRFRTAEEVRKGVKFFDDHFGMRVPPGCLAWMIQDPNVPDERQLTGDDWERAVVLVNTQPRAIEFSIPLGEWQVFVDSRQAGNTVIRDTTADLQPMSAVVAARSVLILAELRKFGETLK